MFFVFERDFLFVTLDQAVLMSVCLMSAGIKSVYHHPARKAAFLCVHVCPDGWEAWDSLSCCSSGAVSLLFNVLILFHECRAFTFVMFRS